MKTTRQYLTTVLILLTFSPQVFGWGGDGHAWVGAIAERHLTPKTRAAVKDLLGDRSLAEVAFWADTVKSAIPESSGWHFATVKEGAESFVLERDCKSDKSCVVEQIILDMAFLRNPEETHADKAQTLKFLVHFVGDIHQPLHLSRGYDGGGNGKWVKFYGKDISLHSLWDDGLIRHAGLNSQAYLARLVSIARKTKPQTLDPVDWANESLTLAYNNAYDLPEDGKLGDNYYRRNITVVNQRLALAGVRLAAILNGIFDPKIPEDD